MVPRNNRNFECRVLGCVGETSRHKLRRKLRRKLLVFSVGYFLRRGERVTHTTAVVGTTVYTNYYQVVIILEHHNKGCVRLTLIIVGIMNVHTFYDEGCVRHTHY